jgi:hypothetical protein
MEMITTTHRAFDLIYTLVILPTGGTITADPIVNNVVTIGSLFDYTTMVTKGKITIKNIKTNQIMNFVVGDNAFDTPFDEGEWEILTNEPFEYVCFSPLLNPDKYPIREKLTPFRLLSGQYMEIMKGKKLFLAVGQISVDDKKFTGVDRIKFTTENKTVTALEDSYGFFVE